MKYTNCNISFFKRLSRNQPFCFSNTLETYTCTEIVLNTAWYNKQQSAYIFPSALCLSSFSWLLPPPPPLSVISSDFPISIIYVFWFATNCTAQHIHIICKQTFQMTSMVSLKSFDLFMMMMMMMTGKMSFVWCGN